MALCQENNTVKRIYVSDNNDYIRPINVVDIEKPSDTFFKK